ncbi:Arylsulfatase A [Fodinibius roseus]|uniref:Arylsulfatase A n=1 Tax=Fodinibius roseus TaxID=1194090 RepID=A0A1M5DRX0_9BACT|nr:arylsulfatase [Fodinibius roseus]SHF69747.1 Arylsulfatase A [Fodinibius roseus]
MITGNRFTLQLQIVIASLVICAFLGGCNRDDRSASPAPEKPNIVILFADDMGYGDAGAYNSESRIPTPHLDRLAQEGMRFTDAHAPGAVCHPSRYGLLTGRYPFRTNTGVWPNEPVIDEDRMTIASLLQSEGYRTAMVGKWHLGFDESHTTDRSANLQAGENTRAAYRQYDPDIPLTGGPVDRGFDSFFGIRASTDIPPYFYIRGDQVVTPPTDTVESHYSGGKWTDIQGAFWRAGGIAPDLDLSDVLPRFTRESIDIIQRHGSEHSDQPLLLYVAFPAPHTPWLPAPEFEGVSGAGMYGDFTAMVDAKVGEILAALEQENMSDETLVIFTSDNGPVWYDKDREQFNHDSQGGLRGMKGDAYEAGHRMPFIVRWPGVIDPGSVTSQTISFTDMMATFADILAVDLPEGAGEDSFSLLPVLTGDQPEDESIRPPVVSVSARGVRAIQDGQWKLIEALGSGGFTDPAHIEAGPGDPGGQLYNLEEDLAETNNVWNKHPEVVDRLKGRLEQYE